MKDKEKKIAIKLYDYFVKHFSREFLKNNNHLELIDAVHSIINITTDFDIFQLLHMQKIINDKNNKNIELKNIYVIYNSMIQDKMSRYDNKFDKEKLN